MDLTTQDYKDIIEFYNIKKDKKHTYKELAENILATKLCKCIKKVKAPQRNEKGAIALCRKSIFKNRNIDFYKFECKKKYKLISKKNNTKKVLKKTKKKTKFNTLKNKK